ncbi:M3 family metallopeptidase [Paeniglutamicibacter cryotolerans]|uniref:Peptidyl-dipeptidase Dcp n=1 Tax=Paeniglutamicibacter cryotolerans TaxID=670079 RepID=A0A839QMV9_9MICC|nr:M3 family metallopeptidase [Paeniglutamicibacter cryotolerans]MBB2997110.1 peptidyl-dipeptidase Dcp [Paeniglutamicibacter cryotolerans]
MPNPLLERSPLPYELPDFPLIGPADYLQAATLGAREQLTELALLATDASPATFETTFVALERSGQLLRRTLMAYSNVLPSHGTAELLDIDARMQALSNAHHDAIHLDGDLYARLLQVDASALRGEDARLVEQTLRDFRQAGAELQPAAKEALRSLNASITELSSTYSRRLLAGLNDAAVHFDSAADLAGLDAAALENAAAAALAAGYEGGYLITMILPTAQPVLEQLELSATRRRIFEASLNRGTAGEHKTIDIGARMAELRADRAALLGYATHADYALAAQTAPSLAAVRERLAALVPAALANARTEADILSAATGSPIRPWDWAFRSAAVARDRYAVDRAALRPWFELDKVITDGVFAAATGLYGITFTERPDLPVMHPDVRTWEVANVDGSALGLFTGDYFARPTKAGGAWMNSIRDGASLLGELPVVTNNLNIPAPAPGAPALLSLDELTTVFHEFGHALHGLFSAATYPSLAGTNVPRDFVEYPSQVNEMWATWPELAHRYAVHHETGEALPEGILEKLDAASLWGEGFATTEYLGAAVLDLAWHSLTTGQRVEDPLSFERDALLEAGLDPELVPPRYRTGYFKHVFDGGYAAGYYSYIWSEVLDADTVEWFKENGGLSRSAGEVFRNELLARGNTRDPLESYRAFRGRDARIEPLLERRGLKG